MASSVIHLCVANEINKIIKRDTKSILIGSIAPDIAKILGETKDKSHFLDKDRIADIPNMKKFLDKYKNYLKDDFVMGYYIHLYTDYIWFKYFMPEFIKGDYVYKLNGDKVKLTPKEKQDYFYNDYTNINIKLIDNYDMDLSIFYEDIPEFSNIITEIPMGKLKKIVDKAGIIIENSKEGKSYIFDEGIVTKFIKLTTCFILDNIKYINL